MLPARMERQDEGPNSKSYGEADDLQNGAALLAFKFQTNGARLRVMKPECPSKQAISKAFWPAVLVSANTRSAEDAIADAIGISEPEDFATDAFLICVLRLLIQRSRIVVEQQESNRDPVLSTLPIELQRVLRLPTYYRHCYVLRILLGLSEDVCTALLHLDQRSLSKITSAAVCRLAAVQEGGEKITDHGWSWRLEEVGVAEEQLS